MISAILSLALAAATSNVADPDGATPPTTEQPAKPAKPKKVCQKVEMSGSNVPKRVCRTVVEAAKPAAEVARTDAEQTTSGDTN